MQPPVTMPCERAWPGRRRGMGPLPGRGNANCMTRGRAGEGPAWHAVCPPVRPIKDRPSRRLGGLPSRLPRSRGLGVDGGGGDVTWQGIVVGIGDEVGRAIIRAARPSASGKRSDRRPAVVSRKERAAGATCARPVGVVHSACVTLSARWQRDRVAVASEVAVG